ncbi:hypothetical protein BC829DRAFT_287176 [Chytridium lagenaria]|nr:hypothetical protein BC829DRAFT_287176 [Chytridium lagenaria]
MTSPASRGRLVLIPFMDIVERRYFRLDTNDRQMHMNNSSHLGYAPGKGPWRPAFPVYTEGSMWLVPDRHEPDERGVMRESIRVTERELAQLCAAAAQSDETEYRDRRSRNSSSASSFETLTLPRGYSLRKFTPAFSLMTERFMCSGSQVCINQGGLPSSALLLCYGHASCLEVNVKTNSFEESERASNLNDVIDISVGLVEDAVISFLRTAGSTAIAYELLHRPLYSAPESLSPRARFRTDKLVNGGSSAAGKGCVPPNWVPGMLPLPHELDLPPYVLPMPGEPMDVRGAWKNVAERERRRLEVEKGKEKAEFDVRLYEKARKLLVDYGLMPPAMDDEVDNPGESFFHLPLKDMTPDRLFTTIRVLLMSHTEFEVYEREPKMLKAHYFISSDSDSDTGGEDVLSEKTRMAKVLSHMKRSNAAEPPIHGVDDDEVMSDVSDYDDFEWNPPRATSPIGTWEPDGLTIRLKDGALIPAECLDINDLPPKTHVSNLPLPPILTQPQLPQPEQPLQTPQLFEPYHYPQTPRYSPPLFLHLPPKLLQPPQRGLLQRHRTSVQDGIDRSYTGHTLR